MKVIAKKNRELTLINAQNTQNENNVETITLVVPEEYEDYNKKIVFVTDDGTVWDIITNNEYKITNAITKYKQVDFYIWLTKEVDGENKDFRTKTRTLKFFHNKDASDEITPEEIHGVNTVVNILEEEIEKVENLNIEATKIGSTTTVTITKKDGTTESVEINDGANGQDGQDGQDGYTPQKGVDYYTQADKEEIENAVEEDITPILNNKADKSEIPDVSNFITKSVNDLINYYLKDETYTKQEVNNLIGAIQQFHYEIVQELPSTGANNILYLVPRTESETSNVYDEYVYANNNWEKIGSTDIDLTDYVKNTDYATNNKGGTIKSDNGFGTYVTGDGKLRASVQSYENYNSLTDYLLIGKGTLENVITGKGLVSDTDYASSSKGGAVKVNTSVGTDINNNGLLYATNIPYNSYSGASNNLFISKGTLENVIAGKGLGDYNSLNNKPTIPDELADLNDDSTHRTVTDTEKTAWDSKVDDVQIDGTSITSNGIANIPIASNSSSQGGLIKYGNGIYGIKNISGGVIGIIKPTDAEIEAQSTGWRVLTPAQLSKAVKEGVTNNSITLTNTEKANARNWIGAEGNTWEKLVDKTLQSDNSTALAYTDYAYEGKFKKIRIQIRGTVDINNANISFYRANSTTAYQVFGNVAKNTDTLYEFELEGKPYLQPTAIRDSSVELKVYNVSSNTWTQLYQGRAPVASTMDNITDLKITSNGNFLTGTRVVVWGLR